MHAPPRERLFILLAAAAAVVGVILASDDEQWMTSSLCLALAAVVASLAAHFIDDHRIEETTALLWLTTIVTSIRWITVPAVAIGLALVTLMGLPIVIREEYRRRRAIVREAHTRCVVCDYDLRATRDRCPECGTHKDGEAERLRRIAAKMRARRAGQPIDDDWGRDATITPSAASPGSPAAADASDGPR